jgi:hypothetical protein
VRGLALATAAQQIAFSVIATFLSVLGAGLLGGAFHVTSWGSLWVVLVAAAAAAVSAVVHKLLGIVPTLTAGLARAP